MLLKTRVFALRRPSFEFRTTNGSTSNIFCLTKPFFVFTKMLLETKGVTINVVFDIYNPLFLYINNAIVKLKAKHTLQKKDVIQALQKGESKLRKYYADTKDPYTGVYTIIIILALSNRL